MPTIKKINYRKLSIDSIKKGGIKTMTISWLLLIVVLGSVMGILYLGDNNNDWAIRTLSVKNQLTEVLTRVKEAEAGQRGYLIDAEDMYLESYENAEQDCDSLLNVISIAISENPIQKRKIISLKKLIRSKFKEMGLTLRMAKSGNGKEARDIVRTGAGFEVMKEIQTLLLEMRNEETEVLERIRDKSKWFEWFTIILIATSIVIIAFGLYNMNSRTIPIMKELSETKASLDNSVEELQQTNQYLESAVEKTKNEVRMRAKSEKSARFLVKQLKEKNKELNHFAYIASHDLQEPLRTVSNFIGLFKEEYGEKLGESAQMYFKFIEGGTDKMRNLITSLLNYARLGASAKAEEANLQHLVGDVQMILVSIITETKAEIFVEELPKLAIYKAEFSQLIQNLLTNAIKFTKPNENPQIRIGAEEEENHWKFFVEDKGIGVSDRNQEKIFNIFSKLHSETEFAGQGIGLAFCKRIADLHGGEIWVESEVGRGSTFNFTVSKTLLEDEEKTEQNTSD